MLTNITGTVVLEEGRSLTMPKQPHMNNILNCRVGRPDFWVAFSPLSHGHVAIYLHEEQTWLRFNLYIERKGHLPEAPPSFICSSTTCRSAKPKFWSKISFFQVCFCFSAKKPTFETDQSYFPFRADITIHALPSPSISTDNKFGIDCLMMFKTQIKHRKLKSTKQSSGTLWPLHNR